MEIEVCDSANHRPHLSKRLSEREFTGTPEAHTFKGTKSNILKCILPHKSSDDSFKNPQFDALIIDLSVKVRSNDRLVTGNSYISFAISVLNFSAARSGKYGVTQIYIVANLYFDLSIKSGTRVQLGTSSRHVFNPHDISPDDFEEMLNNAEFKADVNQLFCCNDVLINWAWGGDFTVTVGGYILECIADNISKRRIIFHPNI